MSTPHQELTQPCAWSDGEPYAGKSYILTTTEGPEIVSEPAFRLSATVAKDLRDDIDGQDARIDLLVRRITALEKQLQPVELAAAAAKK